MVSDIRHQRVRHGRVIRPTESFLPFCACCMQYTLVAKVLLICLFLSILPSTMANLNIFRPAQPSQPDCDGWAQKLVGKTLVKDSEESSLSTDQVRQKMQYQDRNLSTSLFSPVDLSYQGSSPQSSSSNTPECHDLGLPSRTSQRLR